MKNIKVPAEEIEGCFALKINWKNELLHRIL